MFEKILVAVDGSDHAKQVTEAVVREFKSAGIPVRGEVVWTTPGKAADAIVDTATEDNAGLIVMGSRGLSDIEGLLLGSVTPKVLQHADRPVLVDR